MSRNTQARRFEGLYVILDSAALGRRDPLLVAAQAIRGGARVLQYRAKGVSDAKLYEQCLRLVRLCRAEDVTFLVNDRVDVAISSGAHGVHVGTEDLPMGQARTLLGKRGHVGVSTHSVVAALRCAKLGPSYVALGPIHRSSSKRTRRPLLGLEGLRAVAKRTRCPIVAIGGMDAGNIASAKRAGASAVAVIGSVLSARNPRKATRVLVEQMKSVSRSVDRRRERRKV
jgi:thiamine-phosphate pyrophosphorylase